MTITANEAPIHFASHARLTLDRLDADAPDRIVCTDSTGPHTAADFATQIRRFRRALTRQGIGHGHIVALIAPNTAAAVAIRFAAGLRGAVTVLCPDADTPTRLNAFLAAIDPQTIVVFDAAVAATIADAENRRILLADGPDGIVAADDEVGEDEKENVAVAPDDHFVLVATGGTTGVSKASIRDAATYLRLINGPSDPTRRQLVCTPLAYIAQTAVDQTLLAGGVVVLHDSFDPRHVLQSIDRDRITHVALVEPLLVELVDCPQRSAHDLSSLRAIIHVGADAPPELRHRLLTALGPGVLVHVYGASEFGPACVLAGNDYSLDRPDLLGSAGRPLPGFEVRVVDESGELIGPGQIGRIEVRSPSAASGYRGSPTESDRFGADGWFHGSDFGELDAAGYLHVRGRGTDRRMIDGRPTWPVDIENPLCSHPAVRYAVAAPVDATSFAAWVVLAPGQAISDVELRRYLCAVGGPQFASVPVTSVPVIPVTEQGKPDRQTLLRGGGFSAGRLPL
ncbi:class I adenylate-forming enzyme family protein [Branchiibius cervicis]|uniref:Class I adenylate-forming enzyme family protein n=1 Tax=Branchiibius cervicis TaxID=908252 RepID=A0ABW2ANI9_9MICO